MMNKERKLEILKFINLAADEAYRGRIPSAAIPGLAAQYGGNFSVTDDEIDSVLSMTVADVVGITLPGTVLLAAEESAGVDMPSPVIETMRVKHEPVIGDISREIEARFPCPHCNTGLWVTIIHKPDSASPPTSD